MKKIALILLLLPSSLLYCPEGANTPPQPDDSWWSAEVKQMVSLGVFSVSMVALLIIMGKYGPQNR